MIKKTISVFLASIMGIIPVESNKNASLDKNFTISSPRLIQADSGETKMMPALSPLEKQVNLHGSADVLPESFDLRDTGKVPEVRNQTGYGTCWAHSAGASAETSIIGNKPEINLSEFHTAYYTYSGGDQIKPVSEKISDIMNRGGTIYTVTNLWSQWIGPVFEKRLRYGDTAFFDNADDVSLMKNTADYHLKNAYMFDFDKERTNFDEINSLVKQFVYGGSAVDVSFYSGNDDYYSTEYFSVNSNKKPKFANHSVVIVGWDDNFPADNFKVKPENNGAWLVKNSWGEEFGDNGYMWISYEERSLCEFAVYELEDAGNYSYNFHHDTFVSLQTLSASESEDINEGSYMASVFSSDDYIQLEAISTYIKVPDTDYEITVYTNLEDKSNPVSGTPSAVTKGSMALTGYFNIPLDDYALIEPDTDFSVVVKMYSENSPYVIPVETSIAVTDDQTGEILSLGSFTTYEGIKEFTGENESFYSSNGEKWQDVFGEKDMYTDEEEEKYILAELEEDLFDGIEPDDTAGLENASSALEVYRNIFKSGTTYIYMGNIALKALGNPVGAVGFSQKEGIVPDGTEVELYAKNGADIYYRLNGDTTVKSYTEPLKIDELTEISAFWVCDGKESPKTRTYVPETKFAGYGDVNADGLVDASDASRILEIYSVLQTGGSGAFINGFMSDYADINQDCMTDSADASRVLELYAEMSTK